MEDAFEISQTGLGKITINNNKEASAYELAKGIIKKSLEPVLELETVGFLKGVRVILHGGTVSKPSVVPKDYDILVLYDEVNESTIDDNLSVNARLLVKRMFQGTDSPDNNIGFEIKISDKSDPSNRMTAQYIDFWVISKDHFVASLSETPEEIRIQVFDNLARLPSRIVNSWPSYDSYSYTEEQIKKDRNSAVTYILILGKLFGYNFTKDQIEEMTYGADNTTFSEDNFIRENLHYLQETLSPTVYSNLNSFLHEKLSEQDKRRLATNFSNECTDKLIKDSDIKGRTRWLFESLLRNQNPDMTIVQIGLLIYGENIIKNGQPLLKEDKEFLN